MLLRLTPELGGDGTTYAITAMNDTGSDLLTLVDTDLLRLGSTLGYTGWLGSTGVKDASGKHNFLTNNSCTSSASEG